MSLQGSADYFEFYDLYFDLASGQIRIDIYGDRKFFKVKKEYSSNSWEIGKWFFTCTHGFPPYEPFPNDIFFLALKKNDFKKFWQKRLNNLVNPSENIVDFINLAFTKETKL